MRQRALYGQLLAALGDAAMAHINAFLNTERCGHVAGQAKLPAMTARRQQQNGVTGALQAGAHLRVQMKAQMKARALQWLVRHIGEKHILAANILACRIDEKPPIVAHAMGF